jgi:hypothetical protein
MRFLTLVLVVLITAPVAAQVVSRPTDPPIVTAENDSWYQLREPLLVASDVYYPAGPTEFFNGNTMVRTGHYNGVPLYADTTLEPHSIVFVPIGRGLMQPYEKVRRGDLAGTTGSRTPSFPTRSSSESAGAPQAAVAPTAPPQPIGAIPAFTPEAGAVGTAGRAPAQTGLGAGGVVVAPRSDRVTMASLPRAQSNDGIWLRFMGETWVSAGAAVPLRASEFVIVGEYAGFPVFARRGLQEEMIYLPSTSTSGLIAPFRLKD